MSWKCPVCDNYNDDSLDKCFVCENPRPAEPVRAEKPSKAKTGDGAEGKKSSSHLPLADLSAEKAAAAERRKAIHRKPDAVKEKPKAASSATSKEITKTTPSKKTGESAPEAVTKERPKTTLPKTPREAPKEIVEAPEEEPEIDETPGTSETETPAKKEDLGREWVGFFFSKWTGIRLPIAMMVITFIRMLLGHSFAGVRWCCVSVWMAHYTAIGMSLLYMYVTVFDKEMNFAVPPDTYGDIVVKHYRKQLRIVTGLSFGLTIVARILLTIFYQVMDSPMAGVCRSLYGSWRTLAIAAAVFTVVSAIFFAKTKYQSFNLLKLVLHAIVSAGIAFLLFSIFK